MYSFLFPLRYPLSFLLAGGMKIDNPSLAPQRVLLRMFHTGDKIVTKEKILCRNSFFTGRGRSLRSPRGLISTTNSDIRCRAPAGQRLELIVGKWQTAVRCRCRFSD